MPGPYVQVAIQRVLQLVPDSDGVLEPAYLYFVSTPKSVKHGANYFDVWVQSAVRPLPVLHGVRLCSMASFLLRSSSPHKRVLPGNLARSSEIYPVLQWLGCQYQLYYYMENYQGYVDCYYSCDGMRAQDFLYVQVRDICDPMAWFRGNDYVPIGMRLMPGWHALQALL